MMDLLQVEKHGSELNLRNRRSKLPLRASNGYVGHVEWECALHDKLNCPGFLSTDLEHVNILGNYGHNHERKETSEVKMRSLLGTPRASNKLELILNNNGESLVHEGYVYSRKFGNIMQDCSNQAIIKCNPTAQTGNEISECCQRDKNAVKVANTKPRPRNSTRRRRITGQVDPICPSLSSEPEVYLRKLRSCRVMPKQCQIKTQDYSLFELRKLAGDLVTKWENFEERWEEFREHVRVKYPDIIL